MARSEYVLSIGDDNVVLTKLVDKKVANAWLGSPDPAMAQEELGEALAEDPKAKLSVLIDTLDQSSKEEEIPKVSILDRRKVLARHINMAYPGQNLRGARMVTETDKKTLVYEFAAVPLDGHIPGWVEFVESLPNDKGGYYAIAPENADILEALAPKDVPPAEEGKNHWRHLVSINVTGGLRQIITKNGRLSLTRLTQAPPPETPPEDFADMILRDFKATITYIRRLGYQVGEPLDLVVLTSVDNKKVLEDLTWDGARSASVYTPYEAGMLLNLGSLGREDQAFGDVLHAAWFASKRRPLLPLTRSLAMGDTMDDIRELAFLAAPYVAGVAAAAVLIWAGWTTNQLLEINDQNTALQAQLNQKNAALTSARNLAGGMPYEPGRVRSAIEVDKTLDVGQIDIVPPLQALARALQSDAVVTSLSINSGVLGQQVTVPAPGTPAGEKSEYVLVAGMQLPSVVVTADEAVAVTRRLESRLNESFGKDYRVQMTVAPLAAQASQTFSGGLSDVLGLDTAPHSDEPFRAEFRIVKVAR
ncbi:MAG: hypothetical protein K1X51_01300 [Rhodospirillaceae bacterium]|nr:hypothetical protein [Rhodospirillaceae bacterium]